MPTSDPNFERRQPYARHGHDQVALPRGHGSSGQQYGQPDRLSGHPTWRDQQDQVIQPASGGQRRRGRRVMVVAAVAVAAVGASAATVYVVKGADGFGHRRPTPSKTVGINQVVRDGTFEFFVTSVECGKAEVGDSYIGKKAHGQFCVVSLTVRNLGDKPKAFVVDSQRGYSTAGVEYAPDSTATMYSSREQVMWFKAIRPDGTVAGPVVYDLPAGVGLATLKLRGSIRSRGVTVAVPTALPTVSP